MNRHRTGTCISMVLSQKRVIRRTEECLTTTCSDASQKDEHHNACCQSCKHSGYAPEKDSDCCHPLAAESVTCETSERNHESITKVEDCSDHTHFCVSDSERIPDCRKYGIENLAVCLIEQVCHPKEGQNFPFVVLMCTFHFVENVNFRLCVV